MKLDFNQNEAFQFSPNNENSYCVPDLVRSFQKLNNNNITELEDTQ